MTQSYSPGNVRVKPGAELKGVMLGKLLNRPGTLVIIGSKWNEMPDGIVEKLAEGRDVIVTGNAKPPVEKKARMGISIVSHLLTQQDSLGGEYKQVIFAGVPHHIGTGMLSKLKFYGDVTTISLDHGFQPDANLSFPNLSKEQWEEELNAAFEE